MSRIRSRFTGPELIFAEILRINRVEFIYQPKMTGRPDFLIGNTAIFVDGDFWHGRRGTRTPDSGFWRDKIRANRKRDRRNSRILRKLGYAVVRIWESDIAADCDRQFLRLVPLLRRRISRHA